MNKKIIDFLKDKFNIALIVIQVLAIISYFLGAYMFFMILFFMLESAFLVVWGVKYLVVNKDSKYKMEIYDQLPYTNAEREMIRKNSEKTAKNNKMIAVMLILLGAVMLFSGFSILF